MDKSTITMEDYTRILNDYQNLKRKYDLREKKWEKWTTEKSALSGRMTTYLCKWQNLKREYAVQNKVLHDYKKIINDAVKYMEKSAEIHLDDYRGIMNFYQTLLKILKGELNNES